MGKTAMLNYILKQNSNQGMLSAYGKWYAKAQMTGTVTTEDLARLIEENCTAKEADVLAVISELVRVMTTALQNPQRVVLRGLGAFKLSVSSKGAEKPEDFSVSKNIKGVRVLFQPETHRDQSGSVSKKLVTGVKLRLAGTNIATEVKP